MITTRDARWKVASRFAATKVAATGLQVRVSQSPKAIGLHFVYRFEIDEDTDPSAIVSAWKKHYKEAEDLASDVSVTIDQSLEGYDKEEAKVTPKGGSKGLQAHMEAVVGALLFHYPHTVECDEPMPPEAIAEGLKTLGSYAKIV